MLDERKPASRAQREAHKAFKPARPATPETEYAKAQRAAHDNRERLRAERLAREVAAESDRKHKSTR